MIIMEWNELVLKRRSVRKYKSTPFTDDQIIKVLEAARVAPSAMHKQPWHFIVVKDEKTKKELAGRQGFAAQAPVIIVALGNAEESPNWWQNDVGIAFEHIILAAADQGLGTCWMGSMARDADIKSILGIPDKMRVVAITPIGVPDEVSAPKQRKSIDEIISWGSYGKKR
jgi:nitroreductase